MKKVIKKILQSSFGFVMGAIVFAIIGVKATPSFVLSSEEVEYDNTLSGAAATTVRQALDYLDNKADTLLAEQNNNNETYTAYAVGDPIEINGVGYHVIAASPENQDYVTLLKDIPLTVDEINTYGGVGTANNHVNMYVTTDTYDSCYQQAFDFSELGDSNHSGGMAYYSSPTCGDNGSSWVESGCTTEYNDSEIKHVVDSWASNKFSINDLKTVDGYAARLVQLSELQQFYPNCTSDRMSNVGWCEVESTTPSWLYAPNNEYWYWTMSPYNSSTNVWYVFIDGRLASDYVYSNYGAVRPVINVYKSKLS